MRIRGRRVILLFASALPLLADEVVLSTETVGLNADSPVDDTILSLDAAPVVVSQPQHEVLSDNFMTDPDENDENPGSYTAAEAIHNEEFKLPSLPKHPGQTSILSQSDRAETTRGMIAEEEQEKTSIPEISVGVDKGLPEINEEVEETDGAAATGTTAAGKGGDDQGAKGSDAIEVDVDAKSSLTETSDKNLQNSTLEGNDESDTSLSENQAATSTVKIEGASEELQESKGSEEEETSEETKQEINSVSDDDEDEEDSLSRVSVDYASKSAGALIIEKSNSFKGTSNLLNSDKDKYAIAPCDEKKFVVVSLSEDILVKQIKLANYERFSSTVKDFQVMGSQTLGKWVDLGIYSASPGNGEQTFDLKEAAWARYLKFKFLSHHGVEYYCTVSQIKVHGSTMVQGFHEQWEESEDNEMAELSVGDVVESNVVVDYLGGASFEENCTQDECNGTISDEVRSATPKSKETDENALNDKMPMTEEETKEFKTGSKETVASDAEGCTASATCPMLSSRELDEKLNGVLTDEELFSSLYDLIPSTLNALPKTSRESPGRQTSGGELRTLHQIGSLAMKSMYTTPKMASDAATSLISNSSGVISTPKMTYGVGGAIRQYIRTELGLLASMWDSYAAVETTVTTAVNDAEIATNQTEQLDNKTSDMATEAKDTFERETAKEASALVKEEVESESVLKDTSGASKPIENHIEDLPLTPEVASRASIDPPMDHSLSKMLENLPSAECLSKLDFSEFKAKLSASKKAQNGSGSSSSSGSSPMEPIFKKLTGEIKLLQSALQVHDQFTKFSAVCYQRVLLDLILEMEVLRTDHDERLRNLEKEIRVSWTRSILVDLRTSCSWIYSVLCFSSPLLTWPSALFTASLRIPDNLYRLVLHRWPAIKYILLSNGGAASSNFSEYLRPFADQMDQLVVEMNTADSSHRPDEPDDEMWRFPVLPIVFVILLGRLVMCCASPSRATLSSRREFLMLKAKALSPSRLRRFTPTKKSSTSSSSGEKKRHEDRIGETKPQLVPEPAYGDDSRPTGAQPSAESRQAQFPFHGGKEKAVMGKSAIKDEDNPPLLVSEPAVPTDDPRSHQD